MATNWVDEVLSGATSTGSKTLNLATGNALSVVNSESESIFTVTSDTTNGGYTSILGIEGQEAVLFLGADNADDAGDAWEIHADTSGNFKIGNRTSGTGSPTRANTFTNSLTIDSSRNITVGVDDTGYDVKFFGATSGSFLLWDESDDALELTDSTPIKIGDGGDMTIYHDGSHSYLTNATGTMKIATESSGIAVTIGHTTSVTTIADELDVTGTVDINDTTDASSKTTGALKVAGGVGITKKLYVGTDLDVDGTANLDAVDIDGAVQIDNTLTVGVDDAGHDVKFFGNTASEYMLWDTSQDRLEIHTTGNSAGISVHTTDTDSSHGPVINLSRDVAGANNDSIGTLNFYGQDDGGDDVLYARIYSQILTAGDGSERGSLQFKAMCESASGNTAKTGVWIKGSATNDTVDVTMPNGALTIGQDSSVQGILNLYDGGGGNTPGYLVLYSPNGTANYIFCEDDGTLKRHTAAPTQNSDGSEIGGQS